MYYTPVCMYILYVCLWVTLEYHISIRLSFLSFCLETELVYWFKISLWHVRCVQYIISAVTSWIAHLMLWMCQYYEVLSSDLMGSMSVDKLWPMPAHTHRDRACVSLPIPGYCSNKMVYPCAICSMLYLWLEMYLITFFPAIRPRLTWALSLRWQERFPSYLQIQWQRSYSVNSKSRPESEMRRGLASLSSACLESNLQCNEPSWNTPSSDEFGNTGVKSKSVGVCARVHFHLCEHMCGRPCDACKKQQMPKHTRDIRCVLKEGLSA